MEHIRIPPKAWVLVCDGAKAIILRNEGEGSTPRLKTVDIFVEPHAPTRELGSERPGRVYQANGSARSAVEQTDWHDQEEAAFLHKVAEELDRIVREQGVKDLVVVAPPRALGLLRGCISDAVDAVVSAEVAKDLTKLTSDQIARHLAG